MSLLHLSAGLKFWKSTRRKLFAVSKSNLKGKSRKRERDVITVDSDVDEPTLSKRSRDSITIRLIDSKLDDVKDDVESIKEAVQDISHLNERCKLPIGLQRIVRDTFQCKICLNILLKPPAMMAKCCRIIIGCEECVNNWYSGSEALTKTCPSCRAERGYSKTMIVRGLDNFLKEVRKVIQNKDTEDPPQISD